MIVGEVGAGEQASRGVATRHAGSVRHIARRGEQTIALRVCLILFSFASYCLSDLESSLRIVTRNGWVHCHAQRSSATALTPKRNRRYPRRRLEYSTRLVARFPAAEPVALDYTVVEKLRREWDSKREVVDLVGDKNFQKARLDASGARFAETMCRNRAGGRGRFRPWVV